jgi:hypothetical protein
MLGFDVADVQCCCMRLNTLLPQPLLLLCCYLRVGSVDIGRSSCSYTCSSRSCAPTQCQQSVCKVSIPLKRSTLEAQRCHRHGPQKAQSRPAPSLHGGLARPRNAHELGYHHPKIKTSQYTANTPCSHTSMPSHMRYVSHAAEGTTLLPAAATDAVAASPSPLSGAPSQPELSTKDSSQGWMPARPSAASMRDTAS